MKNQRQKFIRLIHVAKKNIWLSDEDYRVVLEGAVGKNSCSEMNIAELEKVCKTLKRLAFRPNRLTVSDIEVGSANWEQINYIKGLWCKVARVKTDRALNSFIYRITGVRHPRFLTVGSAQKVIVALKKMEGSL